MTEDSLLSSQDVLVFGLGLMGGSLSMGLRGMCRSLAAVEIDEHTRQLALERGIVDHIFPFPPPRPVPASLIVLAAPILTNLTIMEHLEAYCSGPAVVIDLGSTKTSTVQQMESLNEQFTPIGGHPMCGKEFQSLEHAEAGLFHGATFALTPLLRTTPLARKLARELVVALGAVPIWLDARTHDQWVAFTSHLPYLLSNALAQTTPEAARPLAGPGFRSTSRLAGSNQVMMMDILKSNREHILAALAGYQHNLQQLTRLLADENWDGLQQLLQSGAHQREMILG